ncbi:hypothetical protein AVO41_09140 [Thiomicrospira sp. WB1]|nr:hypothetical protein AVO41_09140 [Thiomicrospira sp. WB1]
MESSCRKNIIFLFFFFGLTGCSQADVSGSYYQAKKKMYKDVYGNKGDTFYVNCSWEKKTVDLVGCGLENAFEKKYSKRAKRTEAEHVIPASWMYKVNGEYRSCYYKAKQITGVSPRDYCQDHDESYRAAHNDLINLRTRSWSNQRFSWQQAILRDDFRRRQTYFPRKWQESGLCQPGYYP